MQQHALTFPTHTLCLFRSWRSTHTSRQVLSFYLFIMFHLQQTLPQNAQIGLWRVQFQSPTRMKPLRLLWKHTNADQVILVEKSYCSNIKTFKTYYCYSHYRKMLATYWKSVTVRSNIREMLLATSLKLLFRVVLLELNALNRIKSQSLWSWHIYWSLKCCT